MVVGKESVAGGMWMGREYGNLAEGKGLASLKYRPILQFMFPYFDFLDFSNT